MCAFLSIEKMMSRCPSAVSSPEVVENDGRRDPCAATRILGSYYADPWDPTMLSRVSILWILGYYSRILSRIALALKFQKNNVAVPDRLVPVL